MLLVGGGLIYSPEYSGADDYEVTFVPIIAGQMLIGSASELYALGQNAGLKFSLSPTIEFGVNGYYRFGRDSSDDALLTGFGDIDAAVEVGPFIRFNASKAWSVGLTSGFDVADAHDGRTVTADVKYLERVGEPLFLGLSAFASFGDDDFMSTYYGVPAGLAAAGRPAHAPDAGLFEVGVKANATLFVRPRWFVRGDLGVSRLMGDAADSPLVQEETQFKATAGVGYRFGGP